MLDCNILHPLHISHVVGVAIFINHSRRNDQSTPVDTLCFCHRRAGLEYRFPFFDECPDAFLSVRMSRALADALSLQLELGFQGMVEGVRH